MTASTTVSRRAVLATGGVAALSAGALLSGCSSASKADAGSGGTSTTPAGSGAAPASTSAAAPAYGSSSSAAKAPKGAAGTSVAKLSDIPVGGSFGATLDGAPILLAQPTAGTVVGYSAICTHQGCPVKAAGKTLNCPCHGSSYDAATGKVLHGPAQAPLEKLSVTVSAGSVLASKL